MDAAVSVYLWILSGYHVLTGAMSFFTPELALKVYRRLYGCEPPERRHLKLILRPWGALSIAVGIAGLAAAPAPQLHRGTVLAIAVLLVLRAVYRLALRRELREVSRVKPVHNLVNAALIIAGAALLAAWLLCGPPRPLPSTTGDIPCPATSSSASC